MRYFARSKFSRILVHKSKKFVTSLEKFFFKIRKRGILNKLAGLILKTKTLKAFEGLIIL